MAAVIPNLNGTYYEITVPGNIVWMMTTMTNGAAPNLTSTYKVINNITINSADVSGNPLESICKTTVATEGPFQGVFDGQGYTITINLSSIITTNYFGLFGYVGNGSLTGISISNLNIAYTCNTITYTDGAVSGTSYFGSLVGYCNKATITNCNITYSNPVVITHSATTTILTTNTGGICGLMGNGSTLSSSTITFNDTASLFCDVTGGNNNIERNVGGICGYIGQFSSTVNNFTNCSLKLTKNTTIGSTINVRRVGGLVGGAFGGLNFNGCSIIETSSSASGTFTLQASNSTNVINTVNIGGLIAEADFRTFADPITNCSMQLNHYTFSIYANTSGPPFTIATLIAVLNATTISGGRIFVSNLTSQANNIILNGTTGAAGNTDYRIGGLFGGLTNILNVSACSVTSLTDYTVTLTTGSGTNAPICYYGGIISSAGIGVSPIDSPPSTYRTISNCNLTINGITNIQVNENGSGTSASNFTYIGGLFGQMNGGRQQTNNLPGVPLIINNCNIQCNNNVSMILSHTNSSTPTISSALYVGGLFAQSQGCTVTSCNATFGVSNNTIIISSSTVTHTSSYVSCGFAYISNGTISNVLIGGQPITTIDSCTITINGNTSVTSNAITTAGLSTVVGGLLGRINNGSSCSNSSITTTGTLTITTVSTVDSAIIGGMVGDAISTAALGYSTLSLCQGTIGGACSFNSNINTAFRGIIGGMAGLVNAFGKLDTNTITYNGSLTMTSTNSLGAGIRFLGGLVGLSSDAGNSSKIITNSSIIVNGAMSISLGSIGTAGPPLALSADNIAGGLFGRLADGTTCSVCSGTFNTLSIISTGSGNNGNKIIAALCGNLLNSATTAAATITTTSITVASTTSLISNVDVSINTTYTGILFGFVQDAATNAGTSASTCTGTFNGKVTLNSNNIGAGAVYMGGIVANNVRSQISSMTLNLLNGVDIDNKAITNLFCYAGLIAGTSGAATTSNIAEIINSTVNVNGTALIDTNSTTSSSLAGGLGGMIDSRFENNTVNGDNCVFTINSSATIDGAWGGGLIGSVTNSALQSFNVSTNTLRAGSLNVNVSSAAASYVAGMIGRIQNIGATNKITVSNNSVLVSNSTNLTNVLQNTTVYVALLFASLDIVTLGSPTVIANNIFTTANKITITASNVSPTIYINDLVAFYTAGTTTFPNNTAYICGADSAYLLNFQSYPSTKANGITIYGSNYPITSEYIVPNFYRITVLPAITIIISCIVPSIIVSVNCCTANICDKNPQVANYSNEVIVNRKGGQAMIANVNQIYASQTTNTARIRVTPVFSSYQQYMTYLQSKNSI